MKQCSRCGQWKDETEYNIVRKNKDGLCTWCKTCEHNRNKEWIEDNRAKYNANFIKNRRVRRARIRANGGNIDWKTWEDMVHLYGDKCLACGVSGSSKTLVMDHIADDTGSRNMNRNSPVTSD